MPENSKNVLTNVGQYKGSFEGYTVFAQRFTGANGESIWTPTTVGSKNKMNTRKYWVSGGVFRELHGKDIWGSRMDINVGPVATSVPAAEKSAILKALEQWEDQPPNVG